MADPVGLIVEMTDDIGKQLTYAALEKQGMPKHEIPELIVLSERHPHLPLKSQIMVKPRQMAKFQNYPSRILMPPQEHFVLAV